MNIKPEINWTKSAVALALLCAVFSFSAIGQTDSDERLDAEAAAALVQELSDGLPDLIKDEAQVESIIEKWDGRQDLAGKTKAQILKILFADLKSVVKEKSIQDSVWQGWISEEKSEDETSDETPQKPAAPAVKAPEKPAVVVAAKPLPPYKPCGPVEQTGFPGPRVITRLRGRVEVFIAEKGFGFIKLNEGERYSGVVEFVSFDVRDFVSTGASPQGLVEFTILVEGRGKLRACEVRLLD